MALSSARFSKSIFKKTCDGFLGFPRAFTVNSKTNISCKTPFNTILLNHSCKRLAHTEGDQEFARFLDEEISGEEVSNVHSTVGDFQVSKTSGSDIHLAKETNDEIVEIRSNVNMSMDDDSQAMDDPEAPAQMVCRPNLDVFITKKQFSQTLVIRCEFPNAQDRLYDEQEKDDQYIDVLTIYEVLMLPKGQEIKADSYSVAAHIIDAKFYDRLLSMLEERGIDEKFCDSFVQFCTAFEQSQYKKFLHTVREFTLSK